MTDRSLPPVFPDLPPVEPKPEPEPEPELVAFRESHGPVELWPAGDFDGYLDAQDHVAPVGGVR